MKTILIAFFLLPALSWSQNDQELDPTAQNQSDWRIASFDASAGYRWYWKNLSRTHAATLVKNQEELVASNSIFYTTYFYPGNGNNRSNSFEINLDLVPGNEKHRLSLGLSYLGYRSQSSSAIVDWSSTTIDTLQLDYGNGNTVPVYYDSIWSDQEVVQLQQKFVSLSGAYLFRTMISRVSGYIGVGSQFGISINREINYFRNQSWRPQYNNSEGTPIFPNSSPYGQYTAPLYNDYLIDSQIEVLESKTVFILTPFVPIGVEFRPFLRMPKWSGLCIEAKGKVGTEIHIANGVRPQYRPFYSAGIGLKYHLPVKFVTPRLDIK